MKKELIDTLQNVVPATGGVVAIGEVSDTASLAVQAVIGLVSLVPTFISLFKKKKIK